MVEYAPVEYIFLHQEIINNIIRCSKFAVNKIVRLQMALSYFRGMTA